MSVHQQIVNGLQYLKSHPFLCGDYGRRGDGEPCCALGALYFGNGRDHDDYSLGHAEKALNSAAEEMTRELNLVAVNDRLGRDAVIQVYQHAIAQTAPKE